MKTQRIFIRWGKQYLVCVWQEWSSRVAKLMVKDRGKMLAKLKSLDRQHGLLKWNLVHKRSCCLYTKAQTIIGKKMGNMGGACAGGKEHMVVGV